MEKREAKATPAKTAAAKGIQRLCEAGDPHLQPVGKYGEGVCGGRRYLLYRAGNPKRGEGHGGRRGDGTAVVHARFGLFERAFDGA